jgi:hypothetical protein
MFVKAKQSELIYEGCRDLFLPILRDVQKELSAICTYAVIHSGSAVSDSVAAFVRILRLVFLIWQSRVKFR